MLRPIANRRHGQHLGPDLEQEGADFLAHRHILEHVPHLNGVLDRQRLPLLNLLRHTDYFLRGRFFGQELGQEFLEFVVDQLVHTLARLRVLLDHLNNALDLQFQGPATDVGSVKTHHA